MLAAFATLLPVGMVLGLLAFGDHGGRRPPELTVRSAAPVLGAAFLLGPIAAAVLGVLIWLVVVIVVIAGFLMFTLLREPAPQRPLRH